MKIEAKVNLNVPSDSGLSVRSVFAGQHFRGGGEHQSGDTSRTTRQGLCNDQGSHLQKGHAMVSRRLERFRGSELTDCAVMAMIEETQNNAQAPMTLW